MAIEHVERRLAAVLAADVAGYSRLMGIDEEGTLARLKSLRKTLVDPAIASHRGRIVKTTGDGTDRQKGFSAILTRPFDPIGRGSFVFVIEPVISFADIFIERP